MKKKDIGLLIHNGYIKVRLYIKNFIYRIKALLKRSLLPLITISGVIALFVLCFFIICDENMRNMGENILAQFQYKINFISVLITSISLVAASLAIIISVQKPKFRVRFINNHGSELKENDDINPIVLGMDNHGNVGYQSCVPSDWDMFLYNYGDSVAENVKITLWFDNIYFDFSLAESGYELKNFVYGCGIFERLSYDLTEILRQGERIEIPRIPFESTEVDGDILKNKGYTTLYIQIYCNNKEATLLKYHVRIDEYDLGVYDYTSDKQNDEIEALISEFIDAHISKEGFQDVNKYNYDNKINPYYVEKCLDVQKCKKLYDYYKYDIDKMIFWGRMYYRASGEKKCDIETILQTEILRLNVKNKM